MNPVLQPDNRPGCDTSVVVDHRSQTISAGTPHSTIARVSDQHPAGLLGSAPSCNWIGKTTQFGLGVQRHSL